MPSISSLRGSKAPWPAVTISVRVGNVSPWCVVEDEELLAVRPTPREVRHLLVEEDLGAELEALLDAEVDERLALDLRVPGDVVDVLLRVDGRDLAAELAEALDDPHGRVAVPGVVRGSEPDGAGADDGDVDDVSRSRPPMLARRGRGRTQWSSRAAAAAAACAWAGSPPASSFAWKEEPQPHAACTFGLLIAKPAPMRASTKSISEPARYGALNGSMTTRTPCVSTSLSPSCGPRSKPSAYWKPEQPPPWTAMRRTLTSPSGSYAISSLIFTAAFSVTVTIRV